MKNLDVSLIEYGLAKRVFTPANVLNLLYTPLQMVGLLGTKKGDENIIAEMSWSVNNFKEIPVAVRKKLVEACFEADAQETELELNRRFTCVIYTLLNEQNNVMKDADCCVALFEYTAPAETLQEIRLWHKWGLKMNKAKHYLLTRILSNMLESERINIAEKKLPIWVEERKAQLKHALELNKKKAQRHTLKLTLTENFIRAQVKSPKKDLKELNALKKEAKKLQALIEKLFEETFSHEIKLAILEIPQILLEFTSQADKN